MKLALAPRSLVLALACLSMLPVACGAAQSPVTNTSGKALGAAPDLPITIHVQAATSEAQPFVASVTESVTTSLTNAGYKVVADGGESAAHATVKVSATPKAAFFAVQVNGQTKQNYTVQLDLSVIGVANKAVIDHAMSAFESDDGAVKPAAVQALLEQLSESGKLTAYATSLENQKKAATAKVAQEEEDLWKGANDAGCRAPTASCEGVREYLHKYPSGKYAADGRKAIDEGTEAKAWAAANAGDCKKPTRTDACRGVENYLGNFPGGAHAAEGKNALNAAQKPLENLRKAEALRDNPPPVARPASGGSTGSAAAPATNPNTAPIATESVRQP